MRLLELLGLRMPSCRHHKRRIDSGRTDRFGDERISALIERPGDAAGRLRGQQRDERRWLFGRRPRQEPIPSLVGVNKNDVDLLDRAQRAPARFGAKSKQHAMANETIGRVARPMQDNGSLTKEAEGLFHETIRSCGGARRGGAVVRLRIR